MKLNMGENLRRLRRERDLTQEQLAEALGVTCQSVSRWENGACYPDVELLPVLAGFFGVSLDRLLGVDEAAVRQKRDGWLQAFRTALSRGAVNDGIRIARAGTAEFPNDFALLNKLMYALFLAGDEDGNSPDWREDRARFDAEIVALGERIAKYCPDTDIRLEATARLAFHHCDMGRPETGRTLYETLPPLGFCRETQCWPGLRADERLPHARTLLRGGYELMLQGLYHLAEERLLPDEELLRVCRKRLELEALVWDDTPPAASWGAARLHFQMAAAYARLGGYETMAEQLALTAEHARAFDTRAPQTAVSSLLLGEHIRDRADFETADTRPLCEIVRDKWLADPSFDAVRAAPAFREVRAALSRGAV